jgi:hypothetical protein
MKAGSVPFSKKARQIDLSPFIISIRSAFRAYASPGPCFASACTALLMFFFFCFGPGRMWLSRFVPPYHCRDGLTTISIVSGGVNYLLRYTGSCKQKSVPHSTPPGLIYYCLNLLLSPAPFSVFVSCGVGLYIGVSLV